MSLRMRAYYYAVLGAGGGIIGWQASNLLGLSFAPGLWLNEVIVGAIIGTLVGGLIGATQGLVNRNLVQAGRAALAGGGLGLAAGAIGLPVGEALFQAVGGAFLELAAARIGSPILGKGLGLLLLGASVGSWTALIVVLLSRAWLEVASGKLTGSEFILDKFKGPGGPAAVLGSDAAKADIVLPDPDVAPQHASLSGDGFGFLIRDLSLKGTFVDRRRVEQARLEDGSRIRLGSTELVYRERR